MNDQPTSHDIEWVEHCLGRVPRCEFTIAARDASGRASVIRNAPFLDDGTPMPTRYWLVDPEVMKLVGRLESTGAVDRAEAELGEELIQVSHTRYAAERDAAIDPNHVGPRPSGGVGGTRKGLKCLHAHYGWFLAGGEDPVGQWIHDRLYTRADEETS